MPDGIYVLAIPSATGKEYRIFSGLDMCPLSRELNICPGSVKEYLGKSQVFLSERDALSTASALAKKLKEEEETNVPLFYILIA